MDDLAVCIPNLTPNMFAFQFCHWCASPTTDIRKMVNSFYAILEKLVFPCVSVPKAGNSVCFHRAKNVCARFDQ